MKGNVLIGQSGGPTAVINASVAGLVEGLRKSGVGGEFLGMQFGIEGFLQGKLIDLGTLTTEQLNLLKQTPSSALGSCRYKLADADLPAVLEQLKLRNIRWIFLTGGNDTMDTIHRIEEYAKSRGYALTGIGIPKTVDNDLFGTDHTPGYGSAARYTALSVLQSGQLARDMQKVDRFVINQTVGRDSGWLAASAALARRHEDDAPHLVYLPERPLSRERVLEDTVAAVERCGFCSIVCGEGVVWEDGSHVSATNTRDRFSNIEFGAMGGGSAALALHHLISSSTDYRGEFQITESLSMCADDRVSPVDREEAYRCGWEAASLAADGASGVMVSMKRHHGPVYRIDFTTVPLHEVAVKTKPVPDMFINSAGNGVTNSFLDYLRPLVGELPDYQRLW